MISILLPKLREGSELVFEEACIKALMYCFPFTPKTIESIMNLLMFSYQHHIAFYERTYNSILAISRGLEKDIIDIDENLNAPVFHSNLRKFALFVLQKLVVLGMNFRADEIFVFLNPLEPLEIVLRSVEKTDDLFRLCSIIAKKYRGIYAFKNFENKFLSAMTMHSFNPSSTNFSKNALLIPIAEEQVKDQVKEQVAPENHVSRFKVLDNKANSFEQLNTKDEIIAELLSVPVPFNEMFEQLIEKGISFVNKSEFFGVYFSLLENISKMYCFILAPFEDELSPMMKDFLSTPDLSHPFGVFTGYFGKYRGFSYDPVLHNPQLLRSQKTLCFFTKYSHHNYIFSMHKNFHILLGRLTSARTRRQT